MPENGWKTAGAAEKYMEKVDIVAPGRRQILDTIARLAANENEQKLRILDIGCGWGQVSEEILKYAPNASILMMDYAEEMVSICRDRFKNYQNINVIHHDLNQGLGCYIDQEFDAVVSCFALHHIELENRVRLYTDIRSVLKGSGIFVNGDLFRCHSPHVNDWEFNYYISWMAEELRKKLGLEYSFEELKAKQLENYRVMGDKPGTIWDMVTDLKQAGFTYVDCLCKYQNLAVLAASNR